MMRLGILCAALLLAAGWSDAAPAASDHEEILAPIQRFFVAFGKRDKAGMLAEVAEGADITRERDGALVRLTLDALTDRIVAYEPGKKLAETIHDPLFLQDGTLAVVWASYSLALDGEADRCGTDSFTLLKLQGRWKIVAIADNSRDKGC